MLEIIETAIAALRAQSGLIEEHCFPVDAESADAAQRKAHQALAGLMSLKKQLEKEPERQTAQAA